MPSFPAIERVRKALGRSGPSVRPPAPPDLDESIIRRVHGGDLPEQFRKNAIDMKMLVEFATFADVLGKTAAFLHGRGCKSAMLSDTSLLQRLNATDHLTRAGIPSRNWKDLTSDQTYDIDAGVTEADYAVAETGTLAIRHRPEHGRLLSLVPFVHVALIEPKILVPDLLDLFRRLAEEGTGSGVTLISGPSKTADIEMNTVTGVHGPNVVMTYIIVS